MKIESLRIENLRAFRDCTISLDDYTCLVGPNGSGESTVLCALNIFFRETKDSQTDLLHLQEEDFYRKDISLPIKITVTFKELNQEAQEDFKNYYRQGTLVISAVAQYNPQTGDAEVKQYGSRKGIKGFASFFEREGEGAKVADLKEIYSKLRNEFSGLPTAGTKVNMIEALHSYEKEHEELCELLPSSDQFYGWTHGQNRLKKYIQWIYVPAVKDASTEQAEGKNTFLSRLLERTVRMKIDFDGEIGQLRNQLREKYGELLEKHQPTLHELSKSLEQRLWEWAHPDASLRLEWRADPDKSVRLDPPLAEVIAGEGVFSGKISRLGHGFQRSYLLALLHELSSIERTDDTIMILGCEEPELYQHPPQLRHLRDVLTKLSEKDSQIIVCTHHPIFVVGKSFEDVRVVRQDRINNQPRVAFVTPRQVEDLVSQVRESKAPSKDLGVVAKIHQALQPGISELFFSPVPVLVEGLEDEAFLTTYLHLMGEWTNFRRFGGHIIRTINKSHMIRPKAIAKLMGIPAFTVFDSDGDKRDKNGSRIQHERDNLAILRLNDVVNPDPFPSDTFWTGGLVMWKSDISDVVKHDIGSENWSRICESVRNNFGHVKNLDKNALFISSVLSQAWDENCRSQHLIKLCTEIINFAKMQSH
jgi:putative ATP-dependent endonuclease of OLD family